MAKLSLDFRQRALARSRWIQSENDYAREMRVFKTESFRRREAISAVPNYLPIRVLGKGSFGVVTLVADSQHCRRPDHSQSTVQHSDSVINNSTNLRKSTLNQIDPAEVYAMKIIRKSDMLRDSQEGHIRAERDFLIKSEGSRWVVPLIAALQDNTNLYLVMEYMVGGDFMGFLLREDVLDEGTAR
ncbi:hypothetical protein ANO11243_037220 [Dothideomycetidae sp. 11243]|nr:hypothetical protein ANO11243_037220 [fungal sp. No.11243]